MLKNSRVTAFTVFELLRENLLGGGGVKSSPHTPSPGLRLNKLKLSKYLFFHQKSKNTFPSAVTELLINTNLETTIISLLNN